MSSGNLLSTQHPELFLWSDDRDSAQYLTARYVVTSLHDGDATALAMAMEQSAATTSIHDHVRPEMLPDWTIRVLRVERTGDARSSELPCYQLATEVYAGSELASGEWSIELAIPLRLLGGKPAQLFNIVIGELPRLGFLTRLRLESCQLPASFGPGPGFGIEGIRRQLAVPVGPVLCRSMRPGVGLDTDTMARLNTQVLTGGFHMVKDDELLMLPDSSAFRSHLERMLAARDEARDRTGERKGYLANLICEPDELAERWDIACRLGVDAVLVAPFIQGFGTLASLGRQCRLPLLAHNTFGDMLYRHPGWGIAQTVLAGWQQSLGADWFVTSGGFGAAGDPGTLASEITPVPAPAHRAMPILQGGKHPGGLPDYRRSVGSDDYMLIVASWVDAHPDGIERAARLFRTALDQHTSLASPVEVATGDPLACG